MTADAVSILAVIAVIALGFLVVTAFHESLATRDVVVGRVTRAASRRNGRPTIRVITHVLTVGIGIPILVGPASPVAAAVGEPAASPALEAWPASAPTGESPQ